MKHLILILSTITFFIVSCKKETAAPSENSTNILNLKAALKDSMTNADFQKLDFTRITRTYIEGEKITLLRIAFKQKFFGNDFLLVQTDETGKFIGGRIVEMNGKISLNNQYNGTVLIYSLQRMKLLESSVNNGYVEKLLSKGDDSISKEESMPDPYVELPEVIIVSSYSSGGGGISWGTYYSLMSFFSDASTGGGGSSGGGYGGSYYSSSDPYGGGGGGGGGGAPTTSSDPIEFESEYIWELPGVDIAKFFKCFDNVPSTGATFKIILSSDVPSNNNPGASANYSALSGGHTFLTITKTNGASSVTQSFGFYPQEPPSLWDPFAVVNSEIKDNGAQEINASIEMSINETQFNAIKLNAVNWSSRKYDLANYNCSNYAIDIFNSVRNTPLTIRGYQIILPGSTNPYNPTSGANTITIDKSPQMLFSKLKEMKQSNNVEAGNIRINQSNSYTAPISKGECP